MDKCSHCTYWSEGFCTANRDVQGGSGWCFRYRETDNYWVDSNFNKHYYGDRREEEDRPFNSPFSPLPRWR